MIIHTISNYLKTHKRLVIPQLGAFIVKEPGQVLFTELLKHDDGVLRGVLCAEGMSEVEAAGVIDRFVYEVRHAVEHRAEYRMGDFGNFKYAPNGTIRFSCEPVEPEPAPERVSLRHEQVAEAVRTAFSDMPRSSTPKLTPEPCLKGLRYGKPRKNDKAAYSYVGRSSPRRGVDRFLLLAVAAAVIAVAAIAFGYYRKASDKTLELPQTEQTDSAEQAPQTDSIQSQQAVTE